MFENIGLMQRLDNRAAKVDEERTVKIIFQARDGGLNTSGAAEDGEKWI